MCLTVGEGCAVAMQCGARPAVSRVDDAPSLFSTLTTILSRPRGARRCACDVSGTIFCGKGESSMGRQTKPTSLHHSTPQPPKNLTASVATLKAELNATKAALSTEVALKLGGGATFDGTLPRFVGSVTCYVDDATGDVAGLQLDSGAPLCSTAGTPRSFAVPADGYIANVKVAVDKETGAVGELVFFVKSNDTLLPSNVFSCGKKGGLAVSATPKLSALVSAGGLCKSVATKGRRLNQAINLLDPASLRWNVTTVTVSMLGVVVGVWCRCRPLFFPR